MRRILVAGLLAIVLVAAWLLQSSRPADTPAPELHQRTPPTAAPIEATASDAAAERQEVAAPLDVLRLRVTDDEGRPLSGVAVKRVQPRDARLMTEDQVRTVGTTNSAGEWSSTAPSVPGDAALVLSKPGFAPAAVPGRWSLRWTARSSSLPAPP